MNLNDLFVSEDWTDLKPHSIETKVLRTDDLKATVLECKNLNVNSINYNTITCRDQAIR